MFLLLLNDTNWTEALQYNNSVDGAEKPEGFVLDTTHAKLPPGYSAFPIKVWTGDYADKHVLPTGLKNSPYYMIMWDFLATLPVVDMPPSDTWEPES